MATIDPATYGNRLPAFLDLIAWSEGTSTNKLTRHDGYDVIVTSISGPSVFTSWATHPYCVTPRPALQVLNHKTPPLESDACGRYQLMATFWPHYRDQLRLPDFGPLSQDQVAVQQIRECGAQIDVQAGNIRTAILKCGRIWASFPNNNYGQGGKSMAELVSYFTQVLTNPGHRPA